MIRRHRGCLGAGVLAVYLTLPFAGRAVADDLFGVEKAMPGGLTQEEATQLTTEALVAHGRALFLAKFTAAEGAGRPGATGAIVPTHGVMSARARRRTRSRWATG